MDALWERVAPRQRAATPGAATWRGAGEIAPRSVEIIARDEEGQARYLTELIEIFEAEGVDSAFVFLFALENLGHTAPTAIPATI